jgi:hypothetical protein
MKVSPWLTAVCMWSASDESTRPPGNAVCPVCVRRRLLRVVKRTLICSRISIRIVSEEAEVLTVPS